MFIFIHPPSKRKMSGPVLDALNRSNAYVPPLPKLEDLQDVLISSTPANGEVVKWDTSIMMWDKGADGPGAGIVTPPGTVAGDVIVYNGLSWIPNPYAVFRPPTTGDGDILKWDDPNQVWVPVSGWVSSAPATQNAIPNYADATGKLIQNSGIFSELLGSWHLGVASVCANDAALLVATDNPTDCIIRAKHALAQTGDSIQVLNDANAKVFVVTHKGDVVRDAPGTMRIRHADTSEAVQIGVSGSSGSITVTDRNVQLGEHALFAPEPSAAAQVDSPDQGFSVPHMSTADKLLIASPAVGLLVYDETQQALNWYDAAALAWRRAEFRGDAGRFLPEWCEVCSVTPAAATAAGAAFARLTLDAGTLDTSATDFIAGALPGSVKYNGTAAAGKFKVAWEIGLDSSATNRSYQIQIRVNGVNPVMYSLVGTDSSANAESAYIQTLVTLTNGDEVDMWVRDATGSSISQEAYCVIIERIA